MRYLVDITPKQAQLIQKHLDKGNYVSLSQFISTAVENQLSLEENDIKDLVPYQQTEQEIKGDNVALERNVQSNLEKYRLKNISVYNIIVDSPEFKNLVFASQKIPEDKVWIWGQINKIFPVKLGLRILHQLLSVNQSMELSEFLDTVAKEAIILGDKIRSYEETNNKMRDEKISAALPSSDEKSQNRYRFQFMAYQRKDGLLDGAMALMKFCNVYEEKKKQMIGITEPGLKFSSINNPVLDNDDFDLSLNEEESLFYIKHMKGNVKGEYAAMRWMLEKISGGKNTRELLNTEIEKTYSKVWGATDAVINTQRAGITARMTELGLIEKEKEGIYVKYGVSEIGKKIFLK
jgi:hypothetical protein